MQRNSTSTSLFGGETVNHLASGEPAESLSDRIFGWRNHTRLLLAKTSE